VTSAFRFTIQWHSDPHLFECRNAFQFVGRTRVLFSKRSLFVAYVFSKQFEIGQV
jgi:hypothetical protein